MGGSLECFLIDASTTPLKISEERRCLIYDSEVEAAHRESVYFLHGRFISQSRESGKEKLEKTSDSALEMRNDYSESKILN